MFRNSLRRHLNIAITARFPDALGDSLDSVLEDLDALGLIEGVAGQDVQGRRNELDLDLDVVGVLGLGGAEGGLDGVDALVGETGDFDVGADFGGVRGELFGDVAEEFVLDDLVGEFDAGPDVIGVAIKQGERRC